MKRCFRKNILFLGILAIATANNFAAKIHPNAGETSASFLKIAPGGRGVAMGEAQVAIQSDAFGLWYNPATITDITKQVVGVSYNQWFQGMSKNFVSAVFPIRRGENIAFVLDSLLINSGLERRSGSFEDDPYYPTSSSEGSFGAYDLMLGAVYSRKIQADFSAGATLKYILQSIDDEKASGVGVDIGVQYSGLKIKNRVLHAGLALRNFGTALKFKDEAYNLPFDVLLGASMNYNKDFLAVMDIQKAIDDYVNVHFGLEYRMWDKLSLRTGYVYRYGGHALGMGSGFRGGFGVQLSNYIIDYSYAPYSYLGESHRISFQLSFGKTAKKRFPKRNIESEKKQPVRTAAGKENSTTQIVIKPLSISPSSIVWEINRKQSGAILGELIYITDQGEVSGVSIEVRESEMLPAGFSQMADKNLIAVLEINNDLQKNHILKTLFYLSIPEAGGEELKMLDQSLKELVYEKQEHGLYKLTTNKSNISKILIFKNSSKP